MCAFPLGNRPSTWLLGTLPCLVMAQLADGTGGCTVLSRRTFAFHPWSSTPSPQLEHPLGASSQLGTTQNVPQAALESSTCTVATPGSVPSCGFQGMSLSQVLINCLSIFFAVWVRLPSTDLFDGTPGSLLF